VVVAVAVVLGVVAASLFGGEEDRAASPDESSEAAAPGAIERRVQFAGADELQIGGTLALPELDAAAGEGLEGVVVIPGFWPTTRDGISPPMTAITEFLVTSVA
jgi:hypothetical protein